MNIRRNINLFKQKCYKNRANIAYYTGTVLNVASVGWFIYATHKNETNVVDYQLKRALLNTSDKKRRNKAIAELVNKSSKEYAGPTILYLTSEVLRCYANKAHNANEFALTSALSVATIGGEQLKNAFIAKYGNDAWKELNGARKITTVDEETGEVNELYDISKEDRRFYTLIPFDKTNEKYSDLVGANRLFLTMQENFANEDLQKKGVIRLYDFLGDYLGYDMTPGKVFDEDEIAAFKKAGWFYKNEDGTVNKIDIGLGGYDYGTEKFMRDEVSDFLMDLNCCANVDIHI